MVNIDYLIEHENESTSLDFKATQYHKEQYYELLKDVIAMANAIMEGEKLIITGVKKLPDGNFAIHPIAEGEFVDSSTYQKLIIENIEPDIHVDYVPYLYKGNQTVGLLKIPNCIDKPYMMKKAFGSDKQSRRIGESFIRKGTSTFPLMRKDIDWIVEQKKRADIFDHQISLYFSGTHDSKTLELSPANIKKLPSRAEKEAIQEAINKKLQAQQEKERAEQKRKDAFASNNSLHGLINLADQFKSISLNYPIQGDRWIAYEHRSLAVLYKDLERVENDYHKEDLYVLYEKNSEKINISILNEGSKYLEDAVVTIEIPKNQSLLVADKIYKKPVYEDPIRSAFTVQGADYEHINYPSFKEQNNVYYFTQPLGDLRHLQPEEIFKVPLRITIGHALVGTEVAINLTVFGKNLPLPIKDTLIIKVV